LQEIHTKEVIVNTVLRGYTSRFHNLIEQIELSLLGAPVQVDDVVMQDLSVSGLHIEYIVTFYEKALPNHLFLPSSESS